MPQPKQRLRNLKVREVSLVDDGDNPGARVVLFKLRNSNGKGGYDAKRRSRTNQPGMPGYDPSKRRVGKQPTVASVHVDGTGDDDERQRRGERARQRRLRRHKVTKATATTSSDGADPHTHELEFPDGPIEAGRFITSEVQDHTHEVELPDLDPGDSFTLTTSLSDVPSPHTHEVTATAVESVINRRGGSTMKWLDRFADTIRDWAGKEPDEELEKRLFEDIRDERMTEQVAEALMNRVGDLAQSVREIMFGPESMDDGFEPQQAIAETLKQFASAMDDELTGIFAGQIAKRFDQSDDGAPTDAQIAEILTDLFTTTGEPAPGATHKEGHMDLSKLSKEDRAEVEAALEKAGTADDLTTKLAASEAEVAKLKDPEEGDPDPLESLPEDVRKVVDPLLKHATDEATKATEENAGLRKRLDKIEADNERATFAKAIGDLTGLPQKRDEIVDLLWTMTDADARATMQKNLEAAAAAARRGNVFGEIGSGMGADSGTAYAKIEAAAEEIRKVNPKLTEAAARAQAMNENPDLYDAYLEESAPPLN